MTERITSRKNPLLQHIKKLLQSRAYREMQREFAGDGVKLLQEAIRWQAELTAVVIAEDVERPAVPDTVRTAIVPRDVMASISCMESPQGVLFTCRMPVDAKLPTGDSFLVLDGVQDPGNVGTILRTADAFEVPVVLSDGCADPYNPKTVRASMGAVFRSRVCRASCVDVLAHCSERRVPLLVTALSEDAEDIRQNRLAGAVVIGSEGSGVCAAFRAAAQKNIIIPMAPRCESLNAATAAAIVLWELRCR